MNPAEVLTDRQTTEAGTNGVMKALVYHGPGQRAWETKPGPTIRDRERSCVFREATVPDTIPETGDIVIHSSESNATPSFAIYAVPGPDQFGCAPRGEAERMARSCAKRSGVNLWFSEGPSGFTLPARFRGAARRQPRRTPSIDGAIGAVPNRRPTTVA